METQQDTEAVAWIKKNQPYLKISAIAGKAGINNGNFAQFLKGQGNITINYKGLENLDKIVKEIRG